MSNNFDIFQHDGHKLQACGGSTGHFIKTVAMCDSAAIANFLLTAVNAYDKQRALIETLTAALEPFARIAEIFNDTPPPGSADILHAWETMSGSCEVTMNACVEARRSREAAKEITQ